MEGIGMSEFLRDYGFFILAERGSVLRSLLKWESLASEVVPAEPNDRLVLSRIPSSHRFLVAARLPFFLDRESAKDSFRGYPGSPNPRDRGSRANAALVFQGLSAHHACASPCSRVSQLRGP